MNNVFQINQLFTLTRLRRLIVTLFAGLFVLLAATSCSPANTSANGQMEPPEPTAAAVEQAKNNLSDTAVNVDKLSRQRPVPNQQNGNTPSVK